MRTFCYTLLSRVDTNKVTEVNNVDDMIPNSNSESQETDTLPVAMKLQLAIDASLQVSQKQQPSDESLSSSLNHELNIAEQTGERYLAREGLSYVAYSTAYLCRRGDEKHLRITCKSVCLFVCYYI